MENKKLLKFLYKDIAEIEELFVEKGSEGFDEYEIEFIQSRFKGAKQVLQILSEKENKQVTKIRPRPLEAETKSVESQSSVVEPDEKEQLLTQIEDEQKETVKSQSELKVDEVESLESLSDFEDELKDVEQMPVEEKVPSVVEESTEVQKEVTVEKEIEDPIEDELVEENKEEEVKDEANNRLGDSFSKEKSVNELLAGNSNKLEHKISNSPVASIKTAIGINDRYQYIRELFDGNVDTFSKAVNELDDLNSINEAVTYLQQNYKWKKNDTSLKFVSLVKRRFPNE